MTFARKYFPRFFLRGGQWSRALMEGNGSRDRREGGPMKCVKPRAREVASPAMAIMLKFKYLWHDLGYCMLRASITTQLPQTHDPLC